MDKQKSRMTLPVKHAIHPHYKEGGFFLNFANMLSGLSYTDMKNIEYGKGEYELVVRKKVKSRTLNQNRLLWELCTEIATKLNSSAKEIYKNVIERVGQFEIIGMKKNAFYSFQSRWNSIGYGWFCETEPAKTPDILNVKCFFGSSSYSTSELSRVIDELKKDIENMNNF
ncbi:MAG: recombination protein NinB [Clostridiales Family XIII bacterium]|nr:recombination protein NinB [Clostridiales Family XIII bacterium]